MGHEFSTDSTAVSHIRAFGVQMALLFFAPCARVIRPNSKSSRRREHLLPCVPGHPTLWKCFHNVVSFTPRLCRASSSLGVPHSPKLTHEVRSCCTIAGSVVSLDVGKHRASNRISVHSARQPEPVGRPCPGRLQIPLHIGAFSPPIPRVRAVRLNVKSCMRMQPDVPVRLGQPHSFY